MWGLLARCSPTALPKSSVGSKGVWQPSRPWGTQVCPFWTWSRCPQALKRWVSRCNCEGCFLWLFLSCTLLPAPGWSPARLAIIHSCSAMCSARGPWGEAVKCFVHSRRMISKIGQKSSFPVSPQRLPEAVLASANCISFPWRGHKTWTLIENPVPGTGPSSHTHSSPILAGFALRVPDPLGVRETHKLLRFSWRWWWH